MCQHEDSSSGGINKPVRLLHADDLYAFAHFLFGAVVAVDSLDDHVAEMMVEIACDLFTLRFGLLGEAALQVGCDNTPPITYKVVHDRKKHVVRHPIMDR